MEIKIQSSKNSKVSLLHLLLNLIIAFLFEIDQIYQVYFIQTKSKYMRLPLGNLWHLTIRL